MFPAVPPDLVQTLVVLRHEQAWLFLQAGDLRGAEREFAAALTRAPDFYPSEAGWGYVELARRAYERSVERFNAALKREPRYVPALVGRGEALLGSERPADALESFEAALALDPSLGDVRRRVEVLKFRAVEENLAAARRASETGRYEEARRAYERAIGASPESAFLYRELALAELRQGSQVTALEHVQKARELDPSDARALALLGEIHEARGEFDSAADAFVKARTLDPAAVPEERIARARARAELARLPEEYRAIGDLSEVTRGDLAALLGVRLGDLLQTARQANPALITDTRGHWASDWILAVARAGVMEVYENHTFQPRAVVRRGQFAQVASRILNLIAARDPSLAKQWQAGRPSFSDLSPGHLSYPAASLAVAAGVLPLLEGETFQLSRPVAGAEAIAASERLAELSARASGTRRP